MESAELEAYIAVWSHLHEKPQALYIYLFIRNKSATSTNKKMSMKNKNKEIADTRY
jgi:hypothetical protein